MTAPLRLATRGSPLALAQADLVRNSLAEAHGWDPEELDEICPIRIFKTSGDRIQDRPLIEAGGKGLFVKEIEDALLEDEADIAVHSMKDMPAAQPGGLTITAVLAREEPYDIFFARDGAPFDKLPENARLGTSSVRRQAQALRLRPDLKIVSLRGNVETRLLKRPRMRSRIPSKSVTSVGRARPSRATQVPANPPTVRFPATRSACRERAPGAVTRSSAIDDPPTHLASACERGFLAALDGSCRTPLAGLAEVEGEMVRFSGQVLTTDGRNSWSVSRAFAYAALSHETALAQSYAAGEGAADELRRLAGRNFPKF